MDRFDYFVVFAEMRTGSNFLEANLNTFDGISCHGEAFNSHFIGYPENETLLGLTQAQRDQDPSQLLTRLREADGLNGFRYFNNHDPRILDAVMADKRCAKIILTRNPMESFVSWKIASATGQWKLTNVTHAKTGKVNFDQAEFETHLEALRSFQLKLLNGLQKTGQTAFYVAYEDLQDVEIMNGLATFLGSDARIAKLDKKLKKQNPMPMSEKVNNFAAVEASLANIDQFDLNRTPNFEPRRGAMIPLFVAAPKSPLLFMPIKTGPSSVVLDWMGRLDDQSADDVKSGFNSKTIRQWQRAHANHRSFTVLRHPLSRAHAAFCYHILDTGEGCFNEIRETLRRVHKLAIPDEGATPETDASYTMQDHRAAFLKFLEFLKANLSGQTALRVDAAWASQLSILQGMTQFGLPDMILREDNLRTDFAMLAGQLGLTTMPEPASETDQYASRLAAIYGADLEKAARDAYNRDYLAFGFEDWKSR